MKNKNYSIRQVAQLSGVSVATVSRVLNRSGGYSARTEEQVRQVVKQLEGTENLPSETTEEKKPIVGVLVPDITNEYFANIVRELQLRLFEQGFLVIVCNVDEKEKLAVHYVKYLCAQKISALILVCGYGWDIEVPGMPILYIDRHPCGKKQEVIVVESDNFSGGYQAAKELLRCGCRKIAFLTDTLEVSSKQSRYKGYRRVLDTAGIVPEPSWLMCAAGADALSGRNLILERLKAGVEIDGVLCTTDSLAVGAVIGARMAGKRVPEDIKITGYDDTGITDIFQPGITSVRQNVDLMAETATELLLEMIRGRDVEKKHYVIPVTLSCRETTSQMKR